MRNLLILLIFGAFLLPVGCHKATVPEPGPTALDEQQFDDIPVPKGFRLITRRSFSYRSGDMRMGQFFYEGTRLGAGQALIHYEREMVRAIHGWTLTDISKEEGVAMFRKGRDEVRVVCEKRAEVTRVTVEVNYREDAPRTNQ